MKKNSTVRVTRGAMIAALYFVLTIISSAFGLDRGIIQLRLSEMLCVLPVFFPEAVLGLTIGCFISNLLGGEIWDIIFGTAATLIGALSAYLIGKLPKKLHILASLPTILANTLIIPFVLKFAYGFEEGLWLFFITVGVGEFLTAGVLGTVMLYMFRKIIKHTNIQ